MVDSHLGNIPEAKKRSEISPWEERYRSKHRWKRIDTFPDGVQPPRKVRIYRQNNYYRLQWWDPREKRTLTDRVDGDLIVAISRAREIDEQIFHFRSSSSRNCRVKHLVLINRYHEDLERRTNSGEIKPATAKRYGSALSHYGNFCSQPFISSRYLSATQVDREFALQFQAWLKNLQISPNGHPNSSKHSLRGTCYVLDAVRAMFEWATDPDRGDLMPAGFRNPFKGRRVETSKSAPDLFGEPDITIPMAVEFLELCDEFQLSLFSLFILCGLRASEPCFLMRENLTENGWLKVISLPKLGYTTKGRRDKRFPLPESVRSLLGPSPQGCDRGLLFHRRSVVEKRETAPLFEVSLSELETEYEQRCRTMKHRTAEQRMVVRNLVLKEAGGLNYDQIEQEFHRLARQLNWSPSATLKDFRHLFSTEIMNAGIPEYYRKYLLGHAVPNSALTNYTHLNELQDWYNRAITQRLSSLLKVIEQRTDHREL